MKCNAHLVSMIYGFVGAGMFFVLSKAGPAVAQVAASIPYVRLQPTTPGTTESGHSNISGTSIAGQFVGGGGGLTGVNADRLDGIDSTSFLQSIPVPLTLSGNTAAGQGVIQASNSSSLGFTAGVVGRATSGAGDGCGLIGLTAAPLGSGVFGKADATTGQTYGGKFLSNSIQGVGAYGEVSNANILNEACGVKGLVRDDQTSNGVGVLGVHQGQGAGVKGVGQTGLLGEGVTYGVLGTGITVGLAGTSTSTTNGFGVSALAYGNASAAVAASNLATSGTVFGVDSQAYSPSATAVRGQSQATSGTNYGGLFSDLSPSGFGVVAVNSATSGAAFGANFISLSPDARAMYAEARNSSGTSYGVAGQSYSNTGGFGVWGTATANGYAVFGQGRLSATTKLFTIDHPDDPANKYLLHYCEEGPEPLNVYSGKAVTDAEGFATVTLPAYFEKINKDARIQLTVVDKSDDFVQVKVVSEVQAGQFRLRTSKASVSVFWRVEGVRNDKWMQRYGAPVEVNKPIGQKGTYLHPELYEMPENLALNYQGRPLVSDRPKG